MYGLYHTDRSHRRALPPIARPAAMSGDADVAWLDIAPDGRVTGGGIADVARPGGATPVDLKHHPALSELLELVADEDELVGRIVAARSGARFFWFAPAPGPRDGSLRALAVDDAVFAGLVDRFHGDRNVTAAEKRMLFQLVAGDTPRQAARADGVSVETKRAQLKSLCAKLGCSGQTDLVRRSVGQLVHLLHATSVQG